jgi:methyl-accepting chemotaxis protein/methyl-accepting chemotaxis protein-2 (aspartate sensor receptor)
MSCLPGFRQVIAQHLSDVCGRPIETEEDLFDGMMATDGLVIAHAHVQATVEISGMITAIQQDTRHAAGEMSVALTQVNQGVELAQQAAQSIASIHGNNSALIEKIHEIANATAEQSLASTDIARNAERISSMAADNDGAVQHSAQATRQAQALAASLREIVSHFKL